ncbi:hypothetical protein VPH5P1B_0200 [Vibrio phage 5P1b]|nr:hypothetical protein VP495E541_P0195 [Vibrio phage 495E54-1]CAH9014375.1 hypothetical protein VP277E431_P0194 [Vibrio phage 277E43-1]CAH9014404.1 hypothetical protein VP496E541_P0195 [Vibrio phage 496E54-1]
MYNKILLTTEEGWVLESVNAVTLVTFPEGVFEKLGEVQQFTFKDNIPLVTQLEREDQVRSLVSKVKSFKESL